MEICLNLLNFRTDSLSVKRSITPSFVPVLRVVGKIKHTHTQNCRLLPLVGNILRRKGMSMTECLEPVYILVYVFMF